MDFEIEDVVGDVKLTDSQKSVAMSNVYSMDFTDSSSEKHNSSGMETYVLESDSEDSESPTIAESNIINMQDKPIQPVLIHRDVQCSTSKKINKTTSTSINKCLISHEMYTQTSKTIIELAERDGAVRKPVHSNTLETQTSLMSITANKTVECRIEFSEVTHKISKTEITNNIVDSQNDKSCNQIYSHSCHTSSSKFMISETENEKTEDYASTNSSNERMVKIINDESKENILSECQNEYDNISDFEHSPDTTDIDDDSLMEPKHSNIKIENCVNQSESNVSIPTLKSVDKDVAELYTKLYETVDFHKHSPPCDHEKKRFGHLAPLKEETVIKKESAAEFAVDNVSSVSEEDQDVLFTNNAGIKVKLFPKGESSKDYDILKLPPIPPAQSNHGCAEGGNLNFLFTVNANKVAKPNLPSVHEERRDRNIDRWDIGSKDLAAGESPLVSVQSGLVSESDRQSHASVQLPPIHVEGFLATNISKTEYFIFNTPKAEMSSDPLCPISIKEKIKELKMSHKGRNSWSKFNTPAESVRSISPDIMSPDNSRLMDTAERGCELLCSECLKRLRSHSWFEVADALDDLPRTFEKFWGVIPENRIADLLRQVVSHVESPRTQVARAACNTLAMILKNTNYTKKPDFYEAVTTLLIKTGSFSRPLRRAANVALDDIVCGVDLSHAVTALCIHGVSHKNPLVRCAAARLLVVCCALGGGGRDLLRARPPTAASARKHALRSLAALLDDKSTDARKYAERLYSMLRPLSNFEAYYLTDVDVEVAARHMKKYDQLLVCGLSEAR